MKELKRFIQAAGVKAKCNNNVISIYSICILPRHNVSRISRTYLSKWLVVM